MIDSKIKIVSDGTSFGTYLVHAETGEFLAEVASCTFTVGSDAKAADAEIILVGSRTEVVGDLKAVIEDPEPNPPFICPDDANVIHMSQYIKRTSDER